MFGSRLEFQAAFLTAACSSLSLMQLSMVASARRSRGGAGCRSAAMRGAEDPVVDLGVEQRDALTVGGQVVGVGSGTSLDETFAS